MNVAELIQLAGGNALVMGAVIEGIIRTPGVNNLKIQICVKDLRPVSIERIATLAVKVDDRGEIIVSFRLRKCKIVPVQAFVLRNAKEGLVEGILGKVAPGDELQVIHVFPRKQE
jgi:hypothetical protein